MLQLTDSRNDQNSRFAEVAVPVPLASSFTYGIPEDLQSKVTFVAEDVNQADISGDAFDVAILSYSL